MKEEQPRSDIIAINGAILHDKRLTPTQKLVYARIAYFKEYFESAENAAAFLGLTAYAVQEAKRVLERLGYIRCVENTGRGKRYVSDLQTGLVENSQEPDQSQSSENARSSKSPSQTSQNAKSDLANREVRPSKSLDIDKNIDKNENIKKNIKKERFVKPAIEEIEAYVKEKNLNVDPEYFYDYYESNGWKVGKDTMKDWQATVRNWHRRNQNSPAQRQYSGKTVAQVNQDDQPYEPDPTEDIRPWRDFFDEWEEILGLRPAQTVRNVHAAKQLKAENDPETLTALLVALAMRSRTGYLTREIKNIITPADLCANRERVWNFYQENRETWKWQQSMPEVPE